MSVFNPDAQGVACPHDSSFKAQALNYEGIALKYLKRARLYMISYAAPDVKDGSIGIRAYYLRMIAQNIKSYRYWKKEANFEWDKHERLHEQ